MCLLHGVSEQSLGVFQLSAFFFQIATLTEDNEYPEAVSTLERPRRRALFVLGLSIVCFFCSPLVFSAETIRTLLDKVDMAFGNYHLGAVLYDQAVSVL